MLSGPIHKQAALAQPFLMILWYDGLILKKPARFTYLFSLDRTHRFQDEADNDADQLTRSLALLDECSELGDDVELEAGLPQEDSLVRSMLVRWLEHWLGSGICLMLDRNVISSVRGLDLVKLTLLSQRISYYVPNHEIVGLGLWQSGAEAIFASAKLQEPALLLSWMQYRLERMPLHNHRKFFRLIGMLLTSLTQGHKPVLSGVDLYVVGKISVTGNAMSRSQSVKAGFGSAANLKTQAATSFTLVRTMTGCLGFSLTYYYS